MCQDRSMVPEYPPLPRRALDHPNAGVPAALLDAAQELWLRVARHHPETAAHCQRVAIGLAKRLREQGATEHVVLWGFLAGLVHDIGKVAVPVAVLDKRGALTPQEWALIREHPVISERLAREAGLPEAVLRAVRSHHERWDGRGYPDGIRSRAIPWLARVLAVADMEDVMRYGRPYANPRREREIRGELRRSAGRQVDPHWVDTVLR